MKSESLLTINTNNRLLWIIAELLSDEQEMARTMIPELTEADMERDIAGWYDALVRMNGEDSLPCVAVRRMIHAESKCSELSDRLENALEIVHGEGRLSELNAKMKVMRDKGVMVPWPLITLEQRCEAAEAKCVELTKEIELMKAELRKGTP